MKEEIIKIIMNERNNYWDNHSETQTPEVSEYESKIIKEGDERISDQIIKLFKNK